MSTITDTEGYEKVDFNEAEKVDKSKEYSKRVTEKTQSKYMNLMLQKRLAIVTAAVWIIAVASIIIIAIVASARINEMSNQVNTLQEEMIKYQMDNKENITDLQNKLELYLLGHTNLVANLTSLENLITDLEVEFHDKMNNLRIFLEGIATNFTVSTDVTQQSVDSLSTQVTHDMQAANMFESCASITNLSLPFSCGIYSIRSFDNSPIQAYCQLTCNNTFEKWRRIAYLNSPRPYYYCPTNLSYESNPPSCRRRYVSAGCSSVIYRNDNNAYSHVVGRIHAYRSGTPDAFQGYGRSDTPTLEQNYVDGVSLTHGNPRNHIWTLAVDIDHGSNCDVCSLNKPFYVGSHYSCEERPHCPQSVCLDTLWDGHNQCIGDTFFYRRLPQPTTDDIEMRICRDEDRANEDILITFVEIYVQ